MQHLPAHEKPENLCNFTIFHQSSIFEVFPFAFSGNLLVMREGNRYLLLFVEHLTGRPILSPPERATADVVLRLMESNVFLQFRAPEIAVYDNTARSSAHGLQDYGTEQRKWHSVLAHALMSNSRAERMVGTINAVSGAF